MKPKNFILFSFLIYFILFFNISILKSQTINDSVFNSNKRLLNNSFAVLPTVYIPSELYSSFSTVFGLTFNYSYQIIKNLKLSGNLGILLSEKKVESGIPEELSYKKTVLWLTPAIGLKFYLNDGDAKIFLNSHLKYIYIKQIKEEIYSYIIQDKAIGFNIGFGVDIPVYKTYSLEINYGYNAVISKLSGSYIRENTTLYDINAGLRYGF